MNSIGNGSKRELGKYPVLYGRQKRVFKGIYRSTLSVLSKRISSLRMSVTNLEKDLLRKSEVLKSQSDLFTRDLDSKIVRLMGLESAIKAYNTENFRIKRLVKVQAVALCFLTALAAVFGYFWGFHRW